MNTTNTIANIPLYVHVTLPRCPACGSAHLKSYKSIDLGDGSRVRYSRCATCGRRLVLIVE